MAVQRSVFRIEESTRVQTRDPAAARATEDARRRELLSEIAALRALIAPTAQVSREAMERARAQIAEAQAYKCELEQIYAALARTREMMADAGADVLRGAATSRAGRELEAVVSGTERATQSILQAAEEIERSAATLSAALKNEHEQRLAQDIHDRVLQLFEACNFHDLVGQRIAKVIATLGDIEVHAARLMEIWRAVEQFKPVVFEAEAGERRLLNGPKLPGEAGHVSQEEIDAIFGCA